MSSDRLKRGPGLSSDRLKRGPGLSSDRLKRGPGLSSERLKRGPGLSCDRLKRGPGLSCAQASGLSRQIALAPTKPMIARHLIATSYRHHGAASILELWLLRSV